MKVYTLGFTKKTAQEFFTLIKENGVELLIDIRLNNNSQLAGFSKGADLEYFLKELCSCRYVYDEAFTPTKEIMDGMREKKLTVEQYDATFKALMQERGALPHFEKDYGKEKSLCLLCSEETPRMCHRRVLASLVKESMGQVEVIDL